MSLVWLLGWMVPSTFNTHMILFLILQRVYPDLPSYPQDIMKIWMKSVQRPQFPSHWRMMIHRQWTRKKRLFQSKSLVMLLWSVLPLSSLVWWRSLHPLGNSSSPWVLCVSCFCSVSPLSSMCSCLSIFNHCVHCQCFRSWRNGAAACRFTLPGF